MPSRQSQRAKATKPVEKGKIDPRVDVYLEQAPDVAQPVLRHLRALIHAACPGVEETIKWGRPMFLYRGKIVCALAAFTAHCSLGFWISEVAAMIARDGHGRAGESSGQFGRITRLADLPDDATLQRYLAEAVGRLDAGKPSRPRAGGAARKPEMPAPENFTALLAEHPAAAAAFAAFSPSHRREYLEWIVEAKREETRAKRMATAIEWLTQGKARHWKYENR